MGGQKTDYLPVKNEPGKDRNKSHKELKKKIHLYSDFNTTNGDIKYYPKG